MTRIIVEVICFGFMFCYLVIAVGAIVCAFPLLLAHRQLVKWL